jgi:GTP pyrophosphokinase
MPFLSQAETRQHFFGRIACFLPNRDPRYREIERAYEFAKDAFREVYRDDGNRYFEHLRATALIVVEYLRVRDYKLIVGALLHDIVEDKDEWTIERVHREFGHEVALLVQYLTMPSPEELLNCHSREYVYHERLAFAPREFFLIKLPDRLHNILTLDGRPKEKRVAKIEETRRHYMQYAERHNILIHELEHALLLAEKYEARETGTETTSACT